MDSGQQPSFKLFNSSTGNYYQAFPSEIYSWGSLQTPVIGYLQVCSGSNIDVNCNNICDWTESGEDFDDADNDNVPNCQDACPYDADNDLDGDGVCGDIDICPNDMADDSDGDGSCDSDDLCIGDDTSFDPDLDGVCSDLDVCDTSLDWDYNEIVTEEDCILQEVDINGSGWDGVTYGTWDTYTNTCGDGICDNLDECVGNIWTIGNCELLSVDEPVSFMLKQNYPNPFNPSTTIEFNLDKSDYVELAIFDLKGNKVKQLIKEYVLDGNHKVKWDGKDDHSNRLPSSNYIIYLKGTDKAYYRKLTLIK